MDPSARHTFLTREHFMKKLLSVLLCATTVTLCSCVYHQPIEQGNIITPAKIQRIQVGMTSAQVTAALGTPVLQNVYKDGRMHYVYTSSPTRHKIIIKKLVIDFRNDRVTNIRTDL